METFTATEESWAAACMVLEAASSSSVTKMLGWRISGRLERAKTLLASMVNGDLAAVNAIIAAPQLIVDGLHKMRQLAADPALRSSITTDAAVDECLFAPTTVVRQAKTSGEVGGCFFRRGSLFILGLGSASKSAANRDLVFLSQSWSRCPAEKWVPALLEGVWTRVSARPSPLTQTLQFASQRGRSAMSFIMHLMGMGPVSRTAAFISSSISIASFCAS